MTETELDRIMKDLSEEKGRDYGVFSINRYDDAYGGVALVGIKIPTFMHAAG